MSAPNAALDKALAAARAGRQTAEADLFEELRIPSVSTLPEHSQDVRHNCEWLAERFRALGFNVGVTEVQPGGHPVLQADLMGPGEAPRLTIYGHYDVQPPDPVELWISPPFEPTVRDGLVYARGSADNKGNHMAALKAAEYALAAGGPPLDLRFLIEGEEEISGPSLPRYIRENASRLTTDHVLLWDGGFSPDGRPELVTGLRGLLYVELVARGPAIDLHSGAFGGVAPNPLNTLALVIAALKDREGRIDIPGFYDGVGEPAAEEMADWDRSEAFGERLRELMGARALEGEQAYSPVDRIWSRPTLDVNGFVGGFTGEGKKTVIPASGRAKVSMRLVPGQEPMRILEALRAYVSELTTPGVEIDVELLGAAAPVLAGADHVAARALSDAYAASFGQPAARLRTGGTIPVAVDFQEAVGAPMVISGLSQAGAAAHSPNECFSLDHYHRGTEALLRFFWALGDSG
ncbi:MAG: peptidase M20 [Candidatus Nephthysia bennettiae]|uniref:M20/M25/M40 family metallo-hydrolase n=1 Tax=Candidatus Nephthysia bennettiae TaxID=3127016 RepID=A0A934N2L7_9BACT|nr:M20/M25/M40 family metallo-hydrolase [Candidatus Dormibacteraeota bacterium]MBJ7614181.1 M20/M25/M40 family metallo-hydrolase [Candidatus Dormibacteraeota bacterium]PZR99996.1 MAG: peptidase M20 [Candidatus Dormibacteraeota bacterium]